MSLVRTLARNIVSNWAGYAVQVIVTFFLTPYIVASLGQERYGVWTLATALIGYYGLLDLGFRSGINQYMTRYLASGDNESMNKTASTGFFALMGCGFIVLSGTLVLSWNASRIFKIPEGMAAEVSLVIAIMGVSAAAQFVFFTYSAIFTAVQRYDIANAIGIATRLVSACTILLALKFGYGLVGISLAAGGTSLIDYLIRWRVAVALLPSLRISMEKVNRSSFAEFMTFGIWNLTVAGSVQLISYTDALVIAAFLPVSAVAPFALAASLRSYFDQVFVPVGQVFFPAATELDAKGDHGGLQILYLAGSKLMFLLAVVIGSIALCWAGDFYRLWVGLSFAEPSGYPTVALLFTVLMAGSIVAAGQRIGYQVLQGMRRVRLLAVLFALEGIFNLLLSVLLVKRLGIIGVALGTMIPAAIFQGLIQPVFVCRLLRISLRDYFMLVTLRPLLVGIGLVLCFQPFRLLEPISDWSKLVLWTALTSTIAFPLASLVGLNVAERRTYIKNPFFVMVARLKGGLSPHSQSEGRLK